MGLKGNEQDFDPDYLEDDDEDGPDLEDEQ